MVLNFEDFEEKTINRKEIFHGKIIDVALDDVKLPNGQTSKRELVFHSGGVGIIALTPENKMVFVRQFRKPLEKVILEIPAGKIDPGENSHPEVTGKRELEEETGYKCDSMTYLSSMYLSPGFSDEMLYIYLANNIEKAAHPKAQDEDELLELYELTLDEAEQAVKEQTICDAKTIYAITWWKLLIAQGSV
ncbi:ADP-ribose pyrophosphatase [Tetragenococcus koreensis]|uniref:ADP-ribose pyrophosphatase n=1 Tax=Tetragenococcus koreensis TaxID=290335 RepID=A0AAN4UDU0_9ENTE|nr:ADP-ribose diphosphatase [Tetragenococcus koreensis]GEQ50491.1 ADP-ribose pyrophosphatase [Tetragenococcus koreensis]GEQ53004.1 ADP-ribose pyrophosphatase [Tetragenococcus koreensis]GEQ55496.1 ADP-ribose pyrophosphatase [Tetragenococcus koreensis]GEQ57993.1 ADP-ribose pyrophosphatase [Tetragenococcus koreensis]